MFHFGRRSKANKRRLFKETHQVNNASYESINKDFSSAPLLGNSEEEYGPSDIFNALEAFLITTKWDDIRAVLEEKQDLLLTDIAEQMALEILKMNLERVHDSASMRDHHDAGFLMTHVHFLQNARKKGISVAWSELEAERKRAEQKQFYAEKHNGLTDEEITEIAINSKLTPLAQKDFLRTLLSWLNSPSPRQSRHFLEVHPELLDPSSDIVLRRMIEDLEIHSREVLSAGDNETIQRNKGIQHVKKCLDIIYQARTRGGTAVAIRTTFIEVYSGLSLDVPFWLETIHQQITQLVRTQKPDEIAIERIKLLRDAIVLGSRDTNLMPEVQAELNILLCHALNDTTRSEDIYLQEEKIACLENALRVYTRDNYPCQYAKAQDILGNIYDEKSRVEEPRANLEKAIVCYKHALQIYTRDAFPEQYAQVQSNLGRTYRRRIDGERRSNLEKSIVCFEEALQVFIPDIFPEKYATNQKDLGNVYLERINGERRDNLEDAIRCFTCALQIWTLDTSPQGFAGVQCDLGTIYANRIAGEQRINLEKSIICYEQALQVFTLDTFPLAYAGTMINLGNAYCLRVEDYEQANLDQAVACYKQALQVYTLQTFPEKYARISGEFR